MKAVSFIISLVFLNLVGYSQNDTLEQHFRNDFTRGLNTDFSEELVDKMFEDYSTLSLSNEDIKQFEKDMPGQQLSSAFFLGFKNEPLYADNIMMLLNSQNRYQRILAYITINAVEDRSKEHILLEKIKTETHEGNLAWAGMALLGLKTDHTTEVFDFLVKHEDFGDAHMLPFFIKLNKDSLQQTAYNRINSSDIKARILAVQLLSVTGLNLKTENILRQAVKDWDIGFKGFAIYSLSELQIGNLLPLLKPLVDSPQTKAIAMLSLANSPTPEDRNYLHELTMRKGQWSKDLLNSLYHSKNIEEVKYWLSLLGSKQIPKGYFFSVHDQPLITSDTALPYLQQSFKKIKDADVLSNLVPALRARTDRASIDIMIPLLKHKTHEVKYWAAHTLEGNPSDRLKASEIQNLLRKALEPEKKKK